jgi:anti-anti-sigma factor
MSIHEKPPVAEGPAIHAPVTMPLQITVSQTVDRTLVVLAGELDNATAPYLRQRLAEVVGEYAGDIVLDIGLLTFVDSTGLALFLTLQKNLRSRGYNLTIFSPTPTTRRLMQVTGLTEFLCIQPPEHSGSGLSVASEGG